MSIYYVLNSMVNDPNGQENPPINGANFIGYILIVASSMIELVSFHLAEIGDPQKTGRLHSNSFEIRRKYVELACWM